MKQQKEFFMKKEISHSFAYYLPQYHAIPENNQWWGEGFTEWTKLNSAKAYVPQQTILTPGVLGYYTLEDANVIDNQYKLAIEHGIDTFCFWHYWFDDNDQLLEKPAELLLQSDTQAEFCFAWANHSWWNKSENKLLKEQKYDFSLDVHFNYLVRFFKDKRYRKINNKPVLFIFDPRNCKNLKNLICHYNAKAKDEGFDGIYFIFENTNVHDELVSLCDNFLNSAQYLKKRTLIRKVYDKYFYKYISKLLHKPRFYSYRACVKGLNDHITESSKEIPFIFPGWDSTIRHGKNGVCLLDSNPDNFKDHLNEVAKKVYKNKDIVVVKSWNEWAEGNTMEPTAQYGKKYLEAFGEVFELKKGS